MKIGIFAICILTVNLQFFNGWQSVDLSEILRFAQHVTFKCRLLKQMTTDKWRWQCRLCKASASVRKKSFFSQSHLSLRLIIIILIYCWAMDFSQNIIAHEAEIGQGSTHTMVDWASFCRETYEQHLMAHPMEIGGLDQNGMFLTVEIDESKIFHRKYNRAMERKTLGFRGH
jgi:hypothetical protein